MFKLKSCALLLFYSILFSFVINQPKLAQVVIEEEVVLDSPMGIKSGSVTMPFYGRAKQFVNAHNGYGGLTWYDTKVGSVTTTWGPCASSECRTNLNCYTRSCLEYTFNDIPEGTPFEVGFRYCLKENGQAYFIDLECEFRQSSIANRYEIWGKRASDPAFYNQGYVQFTETTPPNGCQGVQICDYYNAPELFFNELNQEAYTYTLIDGTQITTNACSSSANQHGGFVATTWHVPNNFIWDLKPCVNPATGLVHFPFLFNNLNNLPITYLKTRCTNGFLNKIGISDTDELWEHASENINNLEHLLSMLRDICWQYGTIDSACNCFPNWKYIILPATDLHEELHAERWRNHALNMKQTELDPYLDSYDEDCVAYQSNPAKALNSAKNSLSDRIRAYISKVNIVYTSEYSEYDEEYRIQSSQRMYDVLYDYYESMKTTINVYHNGFYNKLGNRLDECTAFDENF